MSTPEPIDVITYGPDLPDDTELRLCGDLSGGKRAVELGVSSGQNSVAFALAGAKAIAVDPDPARVAAVREAATQRKLHVQCHEAALADLGFATSGSVELVLADRTLGDVDDLGRLLRQVHRILKPGHAFVIAVPHPFAHVIDALAHGADVVPYGARERTIGEWLTALERANFRIDALHEIGVHPAAAAPTTLVMRARKEGS